MRARLAQKRIEAPRQDGFAATGALNDTSCDKRLEPFLQMRWKGFVAMDQINGKEIIRREALQFFLSNLLQESQKAWITNVAGQPQQHAMRN